MLSSRLGKEARVGRGVAIKLVRLDNAERMCLEEYKRIVNKPNKEREDESLNSRLNSKR
jgi:hypothetical protein